MRKRYISYNVFRGNDYILINISRPRGVSPVASMNEDNENESIGRERDTDGKFSDLNQRDSEIGYENQIKNCLFSVLETDENSIVHERNLGNRSNFGASVKEMTVDFVKFYVASQYCKLSLCFPIIISLR